MFKKIISSILAVVMMAGIGANVFAENGVETGILEKLRDYYKSNLTSTEMEIAERYISAYESSEAFAYHMNRDSQGAMDMVKRVINKVITPRIEPRYAIYQGVRAPVPSIKQSWYNSCGPTSTLQVLKSFGFTSYTHDSVAGLMGVTEKGSFTPSADGLAAVLNGEELGYDFTPASAMTKDEFRSKAIASLADDGPVILQTIPKYLPYYSSNSNTGHYIVAQEFNMATNTFQLNDCHYDNRYFGAHYVSLQQAYDAVRFHHNGHIIVKL